MAYTNSSEIQMQNLLSAVTDALLAEENDIDNIITYYNVPHREVSSLVNIVRRLHVTLVGQQPSKRFARRLKHDLLGTPGWAVVKHVRRLPARVHIAAAVTVVAGFMLITRHRLMEDVKLEEQEVPALQ